MDSSEARQTNVIETVSDISNRAKADTDKHVLHIKANVSIHSQTAANAQMDF